LGVPVFPVQPYGVTPYFMGYPGTVTLRVETYVQLVGDILSSLALAGFRNSGCQWTWWQRACGSVGR
jgi:creatinine amidohydrolase